MMLPVHGWAVPKDVCFSHVLRCYTMALKFVKSQAGTLVVFMI